MQSICSSYILKLCIDITARIMDYFRILFGFVLLIADNDGNGYLPVMICYPAMIIIFFYTHIQCNSYKDNVHFSGSQFAVIQTHKRSHSEMNPQFLFIIVVLHQSVVFSQHHNDSLEDINDDKEIGVRIFGFEENTDECTRVAKTPKERTIGITFKLLCRHFGPKARDEIINSVKIYKKNIAHKKIKRVFMHCLNVMKLRMISCFEVVFDGYDLAGTERPPECLINLAIFPEKKLQIFWLKKFPLVLQYLDRTIKGYKIFNPSRVIVEKYLNQGLMQRWKHLSDMDYAKTKIAEWNTLNIQNKNKKLKQVIGDPSNILDICVFSNEWLRHPRDFEDNVCLRKILGNLLILEVHLQTDGASLETKYIFGRYLLLHLLHVVKSVIRLRNIVPSRRSIITEKAPIYDTIAEVNEIRAVNIKCLNELRRSYDAKKSKLSDIMKSKELQQCLDTFIAKTENVSNIVKETYLRQTRAPDKDNVKKSEKAMIKAIIKSHKKMKPLRPVIQNMVDRGIPNPSPEYPWAQQFINTFKGSTIANDHAKLGNAHYSTSYSSSTSCKRAPNVMNKIGKCWSSYITQNMIVEKELQKKGLTMQQMYLGDPARTNMIYYIDEAMRKNDLNKNRIIAQYRKSLVPSIDIEALMENIMSEFVDDTNQRINNDPSQRIIGQLSNWNVTNIDDTVNF